MYPSLYVMQFELKDSFYKCDNYVHLEVSNGPDWHKHDTGMFSVETARYVPGTIRHGAQHEALHLFFFSI